MCFTSSDIGEIPYWSNYIALRMLMLLPEVLRPEGTLAWSEGLIMVISDSKIRNCRIGQECPVV